ncbi:hypothetical protein GGI20_005595, partial [Coemansia sp. BCRC 34301]
QRPNAFVEYKAPVDKVLANRRRALVWALEGKKKALSFSELMGLLGLGDSFDAYEVRTTATFGQFADTLDVLCPGSPITNTVDEGVFAEGFDDLFAELAVAAENPLTPEFLKSPYMLVDKQTTSLVPTALRPDFVFFDNQNPTQTFETVHLLLEVKRHMSCSAAYGEFLGQLADYALNIRSKQPMRKFVPMLFLYGCHLDLVVFMHGGYYVASIGPVLHFSEADKRRSRKLVISSLQRMWFLLTLPPTDFGNLLPTLGTPWSLHVNDVPRAIATSSTAENAGADTLLRVSVSTNPSLPASRHLTDIARIDREVHITGRCTYLFSAKHSGQDVILKMTWIRASRLPEGAIYDVLEASNVQFVPFAFCRGIVERDIGGYRLELLLMNHCGESFVGHVVRLRQDNVPAALVSGLVHNCARNVAKTLAQALGAGILHRDVSAGNLAVKDGNVNTIDWGCAKILERPPDALAAKISQRWGVDWDTAIGSGADSDPFTGTPLYMSVQVLLKTTRRSVYNDLESLFYVILDALSDRTRDASPTNAPGFRYNGGQDTALMRLGCLCSNEHYLERFGVSASSPFVPRAAIDAMHQFLFLEGGHFIGDKLQRRDGCDRIFDDEAADKFMDSDTWESLQHDCHAQQRGSTPTKEAIEDVALGADLNAVPAAAASESRPPLIPFDLGGLDLAPDSSRVLDNDLLATGS